MSKLTHSLLFIFFSNILFAQQNATLVILGNVQDAGSPHIGCKNSCCKDLFNYPDAKRKVVSLGLIDYIDKKSFLIEATPDITSQIKFLKEYTGKELPDGILLTHAHIGHYAGLMYLGKEAINTHLLPVYAMPKMKSFLELNGPWSQLVNTNNISIQSLENNTLLKLSTHIQVIPFTVPHRDEYSETVGYTIIGKNKKALFIPDIDKWERWEKNIVEEIAKVDYAFIDATFFDGEEINNRDIKEIPHPIIVESMELFSTLALNEKNKIYFIHMNHTNPALNEKSKQSKLIEKKGFHVARFLDEFDL